MFAPKQNKLVLLNKNNMISKDEKDGLLMKRGQEA